MGGILRFRGAESERRHGEEIAAQVALSGRNSCDVIAPRIADSPETAPFVGQMVVVEVKAVDRLTPAFTAQVISSLKISRLRVGLILNVKSATMNGGIKRVVL